MYVPAAFAETELQRLPDAIEANPFGLLVSTGPEGPTASHVPFLVDREAGVLSCHLARVNPQAGGPQADRLDGQPVLCVFSGPHAYVSPRWYATRRAVPTWNYVAIQAAGTARTITDPAALAEMVDRMSAHFEAGRPDPWSTATAPKGVVEGLLPHITGVEIAVERLDGAFKLSQNRSRRDRSGVVDALSRSANPADRAIAEAMAAQLASADPSQPGS